MHGHPEDCQGLATFSADIDALGDAHDYLMGQFAVGSGNKAGEFYTPQQISDILSTSVTLDSQEPRTGARQRLERVMAIILPHGVLFRGGAEERIRSKLLQDGHIDTLIGLPAHLFNSTGIPVCILALKKCKKPDDVLFINAAEHFAKGKRQNQRTDEHIAKIINPYQFRAEEACYSRRVEMAEIEKNHVNLNISRDIRTAVGESEIDLAATHAELVEIEKAIAAAKQKHNVFLNELGLSPLP